MLNDRQVIIVAAFATLLTACGAEKSKDKQTEDFYDEKLHASDQSACNAKGYVYNNLGAECMEDIALAKWDCSSAGLMTHLAEGDKAKTATKYYESELAKLSVKLDAGFALHQCGDDAGGTVYLVIVNKGRTDKEATIEIENVSFEAAPKALVRFASDFPSVGAECLAMPIEHVASIRDDKDIWAPGPVAAPSDLKVKVIVPVAYAEKLKIFSDAGCTTADAFVTINAGAKTGTFYVKASSTASDDIEVSAELSGDAAADYPAIESTSIHVVNIAE